MNRLRNPGLLREYPYQIKEKLRISVGERSRRFSRNLRVAGSSPTSDTMAFVKGCVGPLYLVNPDVM